jgi:hypothetical protein
VPPPWRHQSRQSCAGRKAPGRVIRLPSSCLAAHPGSPIQDRIRDEDGAVSRSAWIFRRGDGWHAIPTGTARTSAGRRG